MSSRRGQYGVFYSKLDLLALQEHIASTSPVEFDMIPESVIKRLVLIFILVTSDCVSKMEIHRTWASTNPKILGLGTWKLEIEFEKKIKMENWYKKLKIRLKLELKLRLKTQLKTEIRNWKLNRKLDLKKKNWKQKFKRKIITEELKSKNKTENWD